MIGSTRHPIPLTRRDLLKTPALLSFQARAAAGYDRPMRWDNSAGGVVAYYPTKVAMHYRSAWLGDRDNFGELSRGCQKLGMVVVARVDPGGWRI
ncbi:MAG: hypothetical protein LAQ69_50155, partial [Acidobacteriia bacterium]|nr:hypothetical protein [Terriglobia bacterium]